ncbi:heavy-metal-associated domain-containing protein [Sphingomonas sp. RB3P16]|uniref:heavy-metal-associated domain-containing protein n=1 Tax=Parasphingomonas frigoris TaxID=3096163 RepID=UPI002FCA5739
MTIRRLSTPLKFAAALALAATGGLVLAQVDDPDQGVAPADSSGSYEVSGVQVDVTGKSAEAARYAGWRIAQRKGWDMLSRRMGKGGGTLADGTLDAMVSGIVVENEQIGPNRYVATLGVLFSRARAGSILGIAAEAARSSPMLTIPIEVSGGVATGFEQKTAWQEAWSRYRTGNSMIDYVRPTGTGSDALLLNLGQTERAGRGWWRVVLDQYGATDVLVPKVTLRREWPGGPIIGAFEARHGPDNLLVTQFTLRVDRADALPVLLDAGVKRIDEAFQNALRNGGLRGDSGLAYVAPVATPTPTATPTEVVPIDLGLDGLPGPTGAKASTTLSVQADTPNAGSVTATESALQAVPGVRSAITTSLAIGGVSVLRVTFDGDPALLRAALEARGWSVGASGSTLRIRRSAAPGSSGQGSPAATPTG